MSKHVKNDVDKMSPYILRVYEDEYNKERVFQLRISNSFIKECNNLSKWKFEVTMLLMKILWSTETYKQ